MLELELELCYPDTFKDNHKRGVSLNGIDNEGVEQHSGIIFKGTKQECEEFINAYKG